MIKRVKKKYSHGNEITCGEEDFDPQRTEKEYLAAILHKVNFTN